MIQVISAIKNKCWFIHFIKNLFIIQLTVFSPFCNQCYTVNPLSSLIGVFYISYAGINTFEVFSGIVKRMWV